MTRKTTRHSVTSDYERPDRPAVAEPAGGEPSPTKPLSDLSRLKADPRGAIELSAAKLEAQFDWALDMALQARPDITQQQLAERLGVSPGRVSQVLAGAESPRIVTVARYLRALGYEAEVSLEAAELGVPAIGRHRRAARQREIESSRIYVTLVTDGATTAPRFTVIPQSMSADHVELTPQILIGEVTEDSIIAVRPVKSPKHSIVVGQANSEWKVLHAGAR